jgi:Lar family restriction alleviation protein
MEELKPCPFCGSEDIELFENNDIECIGCGVVMPYICVDDDIDAVDAWNRRASGWISVDYRLPPEKMRVMVFDGDSVFCGRYFNGNWRAQGVPFPMNSAITHWMPLPAPPEVSE